MAWNTPLWYEIKCYCAKLEERKEEEKKKERGHPGSNRGPLDLQSNALPLSYIPTGNRHYSSRLCTHNGETDSSILVLCAACCWRDKAKLTLAVMY